MITSKDNDKIKLIRKLMTDKKTRKETGLFVLEGARLIDEAIRSGRVKIEAVYVSESVFPSLPPFDGCTKGGMILVKDSVFAAITDTVNAQGVISLCRILRGGILPPEKVRTAECRPYNSNICRSLILDRIRDPGNLGAIIRTAAAAGYNTIYCIDCTDSFGSKSLRASMGGIFYVDIIETDYSIIDELKNNGVSIIAADMDGIDVFEVQSSLRAEAIDGFREKPIGEAIQITDSCIADIGLLRVARNDGQSGIHNHLCLAIGSEADGLDSRIKNSATLTVSIPMQNVESLNAAVSAGILMYILRN